MTLFILALNIPALIAAQTAPQPRITFDSLHFDFGKISADAKVTHRFKVTNKGNAYLNITRLNPSCGCTSTVLGKWSLAPGESTEVEATFNPTGFRGVSRKSITVISDDPVNPTQTLTFEADVVREIMPSTESVFFQDVVRTAPRKAAIRLESGSGQPVRVTGVTSDAPWLGLSSRQDGNHAWIDIVFNGRKVPASRQDGVDHITVKTANAKVPTLQLSVQWEMRSSVMAEPSRVAWVEAAGQERRSTVVLKQTENRAFRVLTAKTTNPVLRVEGVGHSGAPRQELVVVLDARAKAGMYNEKILLTLDDPDQPELELRVTASLN